MRRLRMILIALVAGTASLVMAAPTAEAGTPVRWVFISSGTRSPLLVGMSLKNAATIANRHHIRLDVLRAFEDSPRGTITEEPRGLPGPILVVVSKGSPSNLWAVLPGAKGPPVHEECDRRFLVDVDSNGSPATCGDRVNVGTWDYFASPRTLMYSLGRRATRCQVAAVYDDPHLTFPMDDAVYEMAKAYYGWTFGGEFTVQLVNAGPYADNCKKLEVESH